MDFSGYQLLPYDCYFGNLLKYDPEIIQLVQYLRELGILPFSNSSSPSSARLATSQRRPSCTSSSSSSSSCPPVKIQYIPMECLIQIFSYLDSHSLCAAQRVCCEWSHLSSIDLLWKPLCFSSFNSLPDQLIVRKAVTMKKIYSLMHLTMRQTLYPKSSTNTFKNYTIPAIYLHP